MSNTCAEIQTVADFTKFIVHYEEDQKGHLKLFARMPGDPESTRLAIVLVIGSRNENNGAEVIECPDEVVSSTARAKQKLVLRLTRDDDVRKLTKLNDYAKRAFEAAYGIQPPNWCNTITGDQTKVKIHPVETLLADNDNEGRPEWKYIGGGLAAKPSTFKRKALEQPAKEAKKKRGPAKTGQLTIADEPEPQKQGVVDMGDAVAVPPTKLQYVLYEKDIVVTKIAVDGVWSATFDRGPQSGVVLFAQHIVRLRRGGPEKPAEAKELELPSFDSF